MDFPDLCMYAPRTGSGHLLPKSSLSVNLPAEESAEVPTLQYPIPVITTTLSISPLGLHLLRISLVSVEKVYVEVFVMLL